MQANLSAPGPPLLGTGPPLGPRPVQDHRPSSVRAVACVTTGVPGNPALTLGPPQLGLAPQMNQQQPDRAADLLSQHQWPPSAPLVGSQPHMPPASQPGSRAASSSPSLGPQQQIHPGQPGCVYLVPIGPVASSFRAASCGAEQSAHPPTAPGVASLPAAASYRLPAALPVSTAGPQQLASSVINDAGKDATAAALLGPMQAASR